MSNTIDERFKKIYFYLTIFHVLSLISSHLTNNNISRLNEMNNSTNLTESDLNEDNDSNLVKIGLFVFTQYCGPGERTRKTNSGQEKIQSATTYADIDVCCKKHDECPNFIISASDYSQYVGLTIKPQLFTRLQCICDSQFIMCLNNLRSQYASTVAFGYSAVQNYCFEYTYPIVGCINYSNALLTLRRCTEYQLDSTKPKIWQWFDIPPASAKIYNFPLTKTR